MPSRYSGRRKGGKKLSFPPGISTSPSPDPLPSPDRLPRANMVSQADPLAEPTTSIPGIVMVAIASCQTAIATCLTVLTNKIEAVQLDMGVIRQHMDKVHSCLTTAEGGVGHVEDIVAEHDGALCTLQSKMKTMEYRAEDAENRS